ncbi:MAG: 50S ribosomal protein L18 [Candidatus Saelkia tenebricola]|nr:50S ribosomal protein L18 [Candidatus Saelkia tenebricola]
MIKKKRKGFLKRHRRVRKKVSGTQERPRLCVHRSLKYIYVQLVNDDTGVTIISTSSASPEIKDKVKSGKNIEAAKLIGSLIAQKAQALGIKKIVFDRGGYKYHGRIKAVAEAARESGLEF